MSGKLLMAQDLIETPSGHVRGGFNMRIQGHSVSDINQCNPRGPYSQGYFCADDMIRGGKIFYTQRFKCECGDYPFPYGGSWVCNRCGLGNCKKDWWVIKVFKDGDAWCCIGLDFEDLQSSDNYAFGDTRQEAIDEYEKLMRKEAV